MPHTAPPLSEDYSDIIVRRQFLPSLSTANYTEQVVDRQFSILYAPLSENLYAVQHIGYSGVPKLFTFLSTTSLEASGIPAVQTQPYLNLRGKGVLVGFLDSGIDYTHPAFRNPDGTTRILGIWDQSDQSGTPPEGMAYGSEYTEHEINEALRSEDPYRIVPERDENGHGTAAAGIACGSAEPSEDFTGAAPESALLFVRLKPAKQYLRDYFLIEENAAAFQENDLMLGVRYLTATAARLAMPLVICITLGSNQGGHTGNTPLEEVLSAAQFLSGVYAVTGTGNEVGMAHHFFGKLNAENDYMDVELLVNEETQGFTVEFWADPLELYQIGFLSPLSESISPDYHGPVSFREFTFPLENTRITIYHSTLEMQSGQQVALIRFENPTVGLWRLRIVSRSFIHGSFHLWLPVTGLVSPEVRFTTPSPDTTLVIPSCAEPVLTVSTYNAYTNSIFLHSGRGFTRNQLIKPDFAAPGTDLTAPGSNGKYRTVTGSSASCALAAGSAALLVEWGIRRYPTRYLSARELKNLFLRGAIRRDIYVYPNREWGYGAMNLYHIFEVLGRS